MDKDKVLGLIRSAMLFERQANRLMLLFHASGEAGNVIEDTADMLFQFAWEWRTQAFNAASENADVAYGRAQTFSVARLIESQSHASYVSCSQEMAAQWSAIARLAAGVFP